MNHAKIDIVMPYHKNIDGIALALERIARVRILSSKKTPHNSLSIVYIRTLKLGRYFREILSPLQLWKELSDGTSHVIIKHINDPSNAILYLIAWLKGIRIIVLIQKLEHVSFPGYQFLFSMLVRWLARQHAIVFSVTQEGQMAIKPYFPAAKYIPTPIYAKVFSKKTYTRNPRTINLISISKYQRRKNIEHLLKICKELNDEYASISWHLTNIGILPNRNDNKNVYSQIKKTIQAQRMEQNVTLQTNIDHGSIPALLSKADLFVLPASSEPLGYAVVEAMAAGLPIITNTSVGGSSYVEHAVNGYIYDLLDPNGLKHALEQFITAECTVDVEKLRIFGQKSHEVAITVHSTEYFLNQFLELEDLPASMNS